MMLNDRMLMLGLNTLQNVRRPPETPFSEFEHKFQEIGLERGWGDNAERWR